MGSSPIWPSKLILKKRLISLFFVTIINMNNFTLSDNNKIPGIGFGTWMLSKDEAPTAVEFAIRSGYRHIDCASVYQNEKQVGEGIKIALDEGVVKREDLFITGKLWNTDHAPEHVEEACRKTISDLGVEYLDLYLVHWAVSFEHGDDIEPLDETGLAKLTFVPMQETWRAMEALVEKRLVKSIGVANYSATMLIDLLSYANIRPVMDQIELHPYNAQTDLIKFCKNQNVMVTAYSPLGSTGAIVTEDAVMNRLSDKYKKSPAQIALRWGLQRGTVVIPKSSHRDRIIENFSVTDFEITNEDMNSISELDREQIVINPLGWWGFPYF